jgi:hypothetical protein
MEAGRIAEQTGMSQITPNPDAAMPPDHNDPSDGKETWRQIDDVLDQLSRQSRSGVSHADFLPGSWTVPFVLSVRSAARSG